MGLPPHSPFPCSGPRPSSSIPVCILIPLPEARPLPEALATPLTCPGHAPPAKIGKQHPDRVVETSTLSSVPPPDITYTLALPVSDSGVLSALQLEAITYACQVTPVSPTRPRPTWGGSQYSPDSALCGGPDSCSPPAATRGPAPQRAARGLPHRRRRRRGQGAHRGRHHPGELPAGPQEVPVVSVPSHTPQRACPGAGGTCRQWAPHPPAAPAGSASPTTSSTTQSATCGISTPPASRCTR